MRRSSRGLAGKPLALRNLNSGEHPTWNKDALISYAAADKETAYRLCQLLEEQGIGCWIAPRDVPPGADYGEAIIRAIEATKATLLLLSAHANASVHVTHEVERATSKRKRVIPVCLEDIQPSPSWNSISPRHIGLTPGGTHRLKWSPTGQSSGRGSKPTPSPRPLRPIEPARQDRPQGPAIIR